MKNLIIFTVFLSIIGIGCSPVYYRPNTQNVPLLSKKGDVNLVVSSETSGATGQASVAVNDYLGVQMNITHINSERSDGNGNGNLYEVGAGYYSKIGNRGIYEAYGLVGFGNVKNQITSVGEYSSYSIGSIESDFTRIGFQQNIGLKYKYFEAAFSTRITRLDYKNFNGNLTFNDENQAEYLRRNSINYLFEPAITLKAGVKNVKLQFQMQQSFNLTNESFYQDEFGASLGLLINFNY